MTFAKDLFDFTLELTSSQVHLVAQFAQEHPNLTSFASWLDFNEKPGEVQVRVLGWSGVLDEEGQKILDAAPRPLTFWMRSANGVEQSKVMTR